MSIVETPYRIEHFLLESVPSSFGTIDESTQVTPQIGADKLKILVINLEAATRRRTFMTIQLDNPEMPAFEFIDAIDGRKLTETQKQQLYDEKITRIKNGRILSDSEIGCALSHIKALERMVELALPFALIVEDDVIFGRNALPCVAKLIEIIDPNKPIVTLLGNAQTYVYWGKQKLSKTHSLYNVHKSYGAYAHLVTLSAARLMLKGAKPISICADDWQILRADRNIIVKAVVPYCISPSILNNITTIGNERHDFIRAQKASFSTRQKIARYLEKRLSFAPILKLIRRVKTQSMDW